MSEDARTDANAATSEGASGDRIAERWPTTDEKADRASGEAAGVEVLWEGEADDPDAKGKLRVVHVNSFDEVQFLHEERGGWYSHSHGAANAVAGHLARLLSALSREKAAAVEAAYREGYSRGYNRREQALDTGVDSKGFAGRDYLRSRACAALKGGAK